MEKLGLRTLPGKLKLIGTVTGISGAMTLTFLQGAEFEIWNTHVDLMKMTVRGQSSSSVQDQHHSSQYLLGGILGGLSCVSYSLWLIIQTKMSESYPCQYTSTALLSLMAALQATAFDLCTEKDWSQWSLGLHIRLLTAVYMGTVVSGVMLSVIAWCVRLRGPLFVSVFNPLALVILAIASSLLLEEQLSVGSVLGSVLVVAGLYVVLWDKGNELKRRTQLVPTASKTITTTVELEDNLSLMVQLNNLRTTRRETRYSK